jgi:hypothetical protein
MANGDVITDPESTPLFYNTFFKRYIGSSARKVLSDYKLKTDEQIQQSILEYILDENNKKLPETKKMDGGYIDFDDTIINLDDVIDME